MHQNLQQGDPGRETPAHMATNPCAKEGLRTWVFDDIIVPLLASRVLLLLVGWFSEVFVTNSRYPSPQSARQGWHFITTRWLDMWGRWDSGWYMNIALHGYSIEKAFERVQSSVAFFPLYPMTIRAVLMVLPKEFHNKGTALVVGLVLSNAALFAALVAIRQLVNQYYGKDAAKRSIIYVITFPTGFFLSCFYPESLFLALSVIACALALKNHWMKASVVGALAAISRPYGIAILFPMVWLYMTSCNWNVRRVRLNLLYFLIVPAVLLGCLLLMKPLTGDLLAPFKAQSAWNRHLTWPWSTLTSSLYLEGAITRIQQVLIVSVVLLSLWAIKKLPSRCYGLYALLITLPSLMSGTMMGIGRHAVVVFPIYMMLSIMTNRDQVHRYVWAMNLTVQVLFMAGWVRFYHVL